jgi:histidine triad (HIT) family protein
LAFLDVNPNAKGIRFVFFEIDKILIWTKRIILIMHFSRKIAIALEQAVPCK